jgi:hypothetical protein
MDYTSILPSYRASTWIEKDSYVYEPLLLNALPEMNMPIITYGFDTAETFTGMLKNEQQVSLDILRESALQNIKKIQLEWEELDIKELHMLSCTGDYFAAEKSLDQDFMKKAHEHFNTSMLAVSIPRKGRLFVTSGIQKPEVINMFAHLSKIQFAEDSTHPSLSSSIFICQSSVISGVIQPKKEEVRKNFWNKIMGKD